MEAAVGVHRPKRCSHLLLARQELEPPFLNKLVATQKTGTRVGIKKGPTVFPLGEPVPRETSSSAPPIKLLTNVEKLRLLSKAGKARLVSAVENFGFSLSTVERLGLLSKDEELGVLSAVTDPGTPGALLSLSLFLLEVGPIIVYVVLEQYPWEVALQVLVALVSVAGGSVTSSFVSKLQSSN